SDLKPILTTSALPPYAPSPKSSVIESLKEQRWTKSWKFNWSNIGSQSNRSSPGLEGPVNGSSVSSRSSSSNQKSIQRRKSEGTSLRMSKIDQGPTSGQASGANSRRSSSRNSKSGLDSNVDHLRVSETRMRRISDSGLNLSSKLSGLAQAVRGLGRSPFSPGNSSPIMSPTSRCSTPTTPAYSPQCSIDIGRSITQCCHTRNSSKTTSKKTYESWDDFLYYYRMGQFPADTPIEKPLLDTPYPSPPPYSEIQHAIPFLAPPLPPNEEKRLRALHSFQILRTGVDVNFERIVQLVASVMGVRGCVISLVDHLVVSVKAQYPSGDAEIPREATICGHTILRAADDPLIVLDTHADWRFMNLPQINTEPYIRFYAGAPLTTSDGLNIGSLCLVDFEPRTVFTERDRSLLIDFAAVVMREMELWNDQVQLCIRNRMMRDVTRWVRGCLDIGRPEPASNLSVSTHSLYDSQTKDLDSGLASQQSAFTVNPNNSSAGIDELSQEAPSPADPFFPTPTGSPTLMASAFKAPASNSSDSPSTNSGNPLHDKAFPAACISIQATLNVDAVYLVQASTDQRVIPSSFTSVIWNCLDEVEHKGSVGVVKGGHMMGDRSSTLYSCLSSSKKDLQTHGHTILDEKFQHTKRQGNSWVCTDDGCRPHHLGDALLNATEPEWRRDLPIIKEMLGCVRQEDPNPQRTGQGNLYSYTQVQDAIENDWFGATITQSILNAPHNRRLLCHTFQGTLSYLKAGGETPYHSAMIVPILGPSPPSDTPTNSEPWAYFVVLSASKTKQFSFHERIYLKNFGSCLVTEVMKRRVEAADKAKGTFIKSISHELRTPLHIILGILELLNANPDEPISDNQMVMVAAAEHSGKTLMNTLNNIIDLAKLDPDNEMDLQNTDRRSTTPSFDVEETEMEEVDIRDLCQKVSESLASSVTDKNIAIVPSWTRTTFSPLSSSTSNSAMVSSANISFGDDSDQLSGRTSTSRGSFEEYELSIGDRIVASERKTILELMVAMDEPERDPDQDIFWSFNMDVKSISRILVQLVENAIKFTTTGFVEVSATPLTHSPVPMKPPSPDHQPILFTVRDTGKGISEEFVNSHLFERFSQENPLNVGTGLGLALVKELIKRLGGWMEVWSEGIEGKGCVVKFLVWATPASNQTKSLRDISGPWQNMSCRFYVGESNVASNRLFKIMGERMMTQQLSMTVERGNEESECSEEMFGDLRNNSPCDLLVINGDLDRLQAYMTHWTNYHHANNLHGDLSPGTPTPLLMLVAPPNMKKVQEMVNNYLEMQIDATSIDRHANIVIMPKPIGPMKLLQCLRECFTPAFSNPHLQTPQGSPKLTPSKSSKTPHSIPMLRSATVPHIPTTALGVNEGRFPSAGTIVGRSFAMPKSEHEYRLKNVMIPPHSPGGLVLPPFTMHAGPSPLTTPESETSPTLRMLLNPLNNFGGSKSQPVTPQCRPGTHHAENPGLAEFRANIDPQVLNLRPQQAISDPRRKLKKVASVNSITTAIVTAALESTFATSTDSLVYESSSTENSSASTSASATPAPSIVTAVPTGSVGNLPMLSGLGRYPLRVLIVEDNITNRMILRTFLKKRGIDFVEAENGKIGVEKFQEEVQRRGGSSGFEFVLMDLQMPVMDGNVATRRIREYEAKLKTEQPVKSKRSNSLVTEVAPNNDENGEDCAERSYRPSIIFALTGLAADEDKRLAFECGVNGYMTKPVSLRALGTLMSSCLPNGIE
ncbi:His Kinase A domain containing protein, partial [Entomortierella beljakovae]